jgi:GT2 family glycosyltransferase
MGRLAHLRQTLGRLVAQPSCSCVVVDYTCPERSGEWVAAHFPSVRVVRLEGRTEFHRSEARNRGADLADAPWICFVDADVRVAANFVEVVRPRLQSGCFYCPDPFAEGTEGTFLCSRGDFERAGGFDEVLQGWGEEDNDLYDALEFLGVRRATYPVALLHHLPHGEDQRGRFHAIEPGLSHAINRVYRILKWDTAKLRGRLLTMPMRQNLYRTVREVVTTTLAEDRAGDLRVQLPYGIVPGGWTLPRSLVYQLVKDRAAAGPAAEPSRPRDAEVPEGGQPTPEPVTGDGGG